MVVLAWTAPLSAQTPSPQAKQTITVAGCAQKEADILKRPPGGNVAMIGMDDEFVLTNAALKGAQPTTAPEAAVPEPAGTSGSPTNFGKVYRVTGDKEKELKNYLGKRVEIVGTFKHDDDARRELGAVATSGKPPVTGELTTANTPEITIESIQVLAAPCSVPK
jgi:hypothetical protein